MRRACKTWHQEKGEIVETICGKNIAEKYITTLFLVRTNEEPPGGSGQGGAAPESVVSDGIRTIKDEES